MVDEIYLGDIIDIYAELIRIADKHDTYPEYVMRDISNYYLCGTVGGERVVKRYQ